MEEIKPTIVPAIIPRDFFDVKDGVAQIAEEADIVHIDICDGKFTKKPTWPYIKHDKIFEGIVAQEEGLPRWEDVDYDIHLMCADPTPFVEQWMQAGAQRIFVHYEACGLNGDGLNSLLDLSNSFSEIGVALKIDTPVSVLAPFKDKIKSILLMTIASIGSQGEPFDDRSIERIKDTKTLFPQARIIVDGGIHEDTLLLTQEAGADTFVIGSTIFDADNPLSEIRELKRISRQAV
jgi:ribulose-phosphate 3-epimerase